MHMIWELGTVISFNLKCASHSLQQEAQVRCNKYKRNLRPLTLVGVQALKQAGWDIVGILRDPAERLESAYNFFQYGNGFLGGGGKFPNGKRYTNIDNFVTGVCQGHDRDPHWNIQKEVLILCNTFCDLEDVPMSRHVNSCEHREKLTDTHKEMISEFYIADYELRGWPCPL